MNAGQHDLAADVRGDRGRRSNVVMDDLVLLSHGDQLPVDGVVVESSGLEIDESLLTGIKNTSIVIDEAIVWNSAHQREVDSERVAFGSGFRHKLLQSFNRDTRHAKTTARRGPKTLR